MEEDGPNGVEVLNGLKKPIEVVDRYDLMQHLSAKKRGTILRR